MLRLELRDTSSTVLFIDPMKGVKIRKEGGGRQSHELCIETGYTFCHAVYDFERDRDTAYEYVLAKINEYLFPQIDPIL